MTPEQSPPPLKQQLMAALDGLPDDATFDEIIERLQFVYAVRQGIEQADQGLLIPHDQVRASLHEWLR